MYQVIYDFFATFLFQGAPASSWEIGGVSVTLSEWLSHTATIVVLALLFVVACKFVVWLTKVVGSIGR